MDAKENKTGKELLPEILKEILQSDKNLLNNKDDLIKKLQDEADKDGSLSRYVRPVIIALEYKVGEILFVADGDSDEAKENVKCKVRDILKSANMRDKNIDDVLESFSYALEWDKKVEPEEVILKENNINDNKHENKKDIARNREETWTCDCGEVNDGNFCVKCGKPHKENDINNSDNVIEKNVVHDEIKRTQSSLDKPKQEEKIPPKPWEGYLNKKSNRIYLGIVGGLILIILIAVFSSNFGKSETELCDLDVGDSIEQMHNILGKENEVRELGNNFIQHKYNNNNDRYNLILTNDKKIVMIATDDEKYNTSKGIHVGSSLESVFKEYGEINPKKGIDSSYNVYSYSFSTLLGKQKKVLDFYVDRYDKVVTISSNDSSVSLEDWIKAIRFIN